MGQYGVGNKLALLNGCGYLQGMSTRFIMKPGYGVEIEINEENNIEISQGEDGAVVLTRHEAEFVIECLQKLVLEVGE